MPETLLDIEKNNYSTPPKVSEQRAVQGLRGGAIVLMVAAFEYFLRELLTEKLDTITLRAGGIPFEKLPKEMRVTAVFESLNLAMKGPRHETAPPKADRISLITQVCSRIAAQHIDVEAFTNTGSNPGSKVVTSLFKNIGIPDILTYVKPTFQQKRWWGAKVADTFIRDKLDEVVQARNVVAHTTQPLAMTRTDLRANLRFVRILGGVLNNSVDKHLDAVKAKAASP